MASKVIYSESLTNGDKKFLVSTGEFTGDVETIIYSNNVSERSYENDKGYYSSSTTTTKYTSCAGI